LSRRGCLLMISDSGTAFDTNLNRRIMTRLHYQSRLTEAFDTPCISFSFSFSLSHSMGVSAERRREHLGTFGTFHGLIRNPRRLLLGCILAIGSRVRGIVAEWPV
jgi:hypothetical protein